MLISTDRSHNVICNILAAYSVKFLQLACKVENCRGTFDHRQDPRK
jgi:hypothetical protein